MRLDRLIFCEGVRQEKSGQLTIIGVFPTDHLVIEDPAAGVALAQLSCYLVFDHAQGIAEFELQVELMRGNEMISRYPVSKFRREAADVQARLHAHVVQFGLVTFPSAGEYTFNFLVKAHGDTIRFSRRFFVRSLKPAARTTH